MHRADERTLATAHHAEPDAAALFGVATPFDRHAFPPVYLSQLESPLTPRGERGWICQIPSMRWTCFLSMARAVKSSKDFSVTLMMWLAMKGAPSAAPCCESFRQHSHSSTAQES